MTIRNFWFAFFTYVMFFAVMVFCAFLFGRGSMMPGRNLSAEERYVMEIEALPIRPYFSLLPKGRYEDFESLIKHGTPNLIVRVTLEKREDATVYDPHGYYTTDSLAGANDNVQALLDYKNGVSPDDTTPDEPIYGWWGDAAYAPVQNIAYYISTPYTAHVEEVVLGDCLAVGDEFTFYAPYGIIDDFHIRYEDCPIFSAGREYYLFFSVVDVEGVGRWYDLTHPSAACEIMKEDSRTFSPMSRAGDTIFADTGGDCDTMKSLFAEYYTEYPYETDIPILPRMKP